MTDWAEEGRSVYGVAITYTRFTQAAGVVATALQEAYEKGRAEQREQDADIAKRRYAYHGMYRENADKEAEASDIERLIRAQGSKQDPTAVVWTICKTEDCEARFHLKDSPTGVCPTCRDAQQANQSNGADDA